jgi:hypothetical protein
MKNVRDPVTRDEIDRLVESELSQPQRRALIVRIENEPGGWRRCGLAFLEAQSWRKSFRSFFGTATAGSAPSGVEIQPAGTQRPRRVHRLSAVVAAIVVSFVVGMGVGQRWTADGQTVANHKSGLPAPPSTDRGEASPPQTPGAESPFAQTVADDGEFRFVGYVNYGNDDAGDAQVVPIISGPGLDDQWLADRPAPLSEYELRRLERLGWLVQQKRQLMKIQFTDGRTLTVPIDSVRVQFVPPPVF